MKFRTAILALLVVFGLAFTAVAQETKEEPAKEEGAKPAAETAPAAAPAPAAETKPAAPEAAAQLSPCAQSLQPLAESYKKAYEDMQKWIAEVNTQTSAAGEGVLKLQAQIKENEDAITKAKLDDDSAKVKDLTKQNKALWKDLDAAKKTAAAACSPVAKEASDRAKQYAADTDKALSELKAQAK